VSIIKIKYWLKYQFKTSEAEKLIKIWYRLTLKYAVILEMY